jgi:hypothetical protein
MQISIASREKGDLHLEIAKTRRDKRSKKRMAPAVPYGSSSEIWALRNHAAPVRSAAQGAVSNATGKAEVECYADI